MKNTQPLERLNLLDNGIDFIIKGIDELFSDESFQLLEENEFDLSLILGDWDQLQSTHQTLNSYKYGVIHLFAGFLLLLKERLARYDPKLIFIGKPEAIDQKLARGEVPRTVNSHQLLEKLDEKRVPFTMFSPDDDVTIKQIRNFRNAFEHYEVQADKTQVWEVLLKFLYIIDDFLVQELGIELEDNEKIYLKFEGIKQFSRAAWKKYMEGWKSYMDDNLVIFKADPISIIAQIEFYPSPSEKTDPYIFCPECIEEKLVATDEFKGICVNCEQTFYIMECVRCSMPVPYYSGTSPSYHEMILCETCDSDMFEPIERF